MTAERVIRLVERRPRLCRLRRDDFEYLLTHHTTQLDMRPTGARGMVRMTPRGFVGTIVAPSCRLEIASKVPFANLLHMLDPDDQVSTRPGAAGHELTDVLVSRFADLLDERIAAGLRRGYVERTEALATARGRVDVAAQLRQAGSQRDRLQCRFDDFTTDTPCHRQLKAVARRLMECGSIGGEIRWRVRTLLDALDEVGEETPNDFTLASLVDRPELADYRRLLELSRLLIGGMGTGDGTMGTFLINLETAFERYVSRGLVRELAGTDVLVDVQPSMLIHESNVDSRPSLTIRPDVVLRGGKGLIIDAKWKRLLSGPETGDLHQAIAYATCLGAAGVVLVYPGARNRRLDYRLLHGPALLGLHRLRLQGDRERCDCSFRSWVRHLRTIIESMPV